MPKIKKTLTVTVDEIVIDNLDSIKNLSTAKRSGIVNKILLKELPIILANYIALK